MAQYKSRRFVELHGQLHMRGIPPYISVTSGIASRRDRTALDHRAQETRARPIIIRAEQSSYGTSDRLTRYIALLEPNPTQSIGQK